jgi:hypothetical protein
VTETTARVKEELVRFVKEESEKASNSKFGFILRVGQDETFENLW